MRYQIHCVEIHRVQVRFHVSLNPFQSEIYFQIHSCPVMGDLCTADSKSDITGMFTTETEKRETLGIRSN